MPFQNLFRRIAIRRRYCEVVFSLPAKIHVTLRRVKLCFSLTEVSCFCVLGNKSLFRFYAYRNCYCFITRKNSYLLCYLSLLSFSLYIFLQFLEPQRSFTLKTNYHIRYCYNFGSDVRNFDVRDSSTFPNPSHTYMKLCYLLT